MLSVATLLAIGIPLAGLAPLLSGFDWWFVSMAFAAAVVGVALVARSLGLAAWVAALAGLLAWLVLSGVAFAPETLLLFIVPTPDTIGALIAGFSNAGGEIQRQTIPANPVASLLQLIAMAAGLLALLSDTAVAARFPAFVGVVSLGIFMAPYAVRSREIDGLSFAATVGAFLLVLWLSGRRGRRFGEQPAPRARAGRAPAAALGLTAAAVLFALTIPSVTPGLTAEAYESSRQTGRFLSVYGAGIDAVIQLGRDLRRPTPVLSLSYVTTAEDPVYLKMVDLTDFSTGSWQPEEQPEFPPASTVEQLAGPPGLSPDVERTTFDSTVSIASLRSDWVPMPYPATGITGLPDGWSADPATGVVTVASGQNDIRGQEYTVQSLTLSPTAEQLAAAGSSVPANLDSQVELPPDLPDIVSNVARQVTASADTNYGRAVALQSYFTSGQFSYSVQTPVDRDFDGSNAEALGAFLTVKSGYCVHFAAAMATMARVIGIPSRIAVGYFPSENASRSVDGEAEYEVMTDQLHSWPELYFDGIGWLPFEPTPGLGIDVPEYSVPAYAEQAARPDTVPSSSAAASPTDGPVETNKPQEAEATRASGSTVQLRSWLTTLSVLLGATVLALAPGAVRRSRRRRALSRIGSHPLPATTAWRELQDFARDYRVEVAQGDTPALLAARLGHISGVPEEELTLLRRAVEREQFASSDAATLGGPDRRRIVQALRAVETAVAAESDSPIRRRARLAPASLFVRSRRG
jgi:transglutaminase-like putative cysteine protease